MDTSPMAGAEGARVSRKTRVLGRDKLGKSTESPCCFDLTPFLFISFNIPTTKNLHLYNFSGQTSKIM
jgi:hypothetical protein